MKYQVVEGSESAHCCFGFTVVDTEQPLVRSGVIFAGRFVSVCECFEKKEADLICAALNAYKPSEESAQKGESLDEQQTLILGEPAFKPTLVCPTCKSGRWSEVYPSQTDASGFTLYCRNCENGCVSPLV